MQLQYRGCNYTPDAQASTAYSVSSAVELVYRGVQYQRNLMIVPQRQNESQERRFVYRGAIYFAG